MAGVREKEWRGGGVHFLYRTYFGGYVFKNANLEGGVHFLLSFLVN